LKAARQIRRMKGRNGERQTVQWCESMSPLAATSVRHCPCQAERRERHMFKRSQLYLGVALAALAEILIRVAAR
jgi:hypothetical protein